MSKSLGNVDNLLDLLDRYDGRTYRLLLLQSHYRSPVRVGADNLEAAENALAGLDAFAARSASVGPTDRADADAGVLDAFRAAMDDDLDTPAAMALLFDTVRRANAALDAGDAGGPAARRRGARDRRRRRARARARRRRAGRRARAGRRRSTPPGRPRTTPPPTPSAPSCRPTGGSSRPPPEGRRSGAERQHPPVTDDAHDAPTDTAGAAPPSASSRELDARGRRRCDRRPAGATPTGRSTRRRRRHRQPTGRDRGPAAAPARRDRRVRLPARPRRAAGAVGDRRDPATTPGSRGCTAAGSASRCSSSSPGS